MDARFEAETKKRLRVGDHRPVTILDLVKDLAVPVDEELTEDEVDVAQVVVDDADEAEVPVALPPPEPAPRPVFASSWGGWATREHTMVREAEDGVVDGGRKATVWEPEFGSLYD